MDWYRWMGSWVEWVEGQDDKRMKRVQGWTGNTLICVLLAIAYLLSLCVDQTAPLELTVEALIENNLQPPSTHPCQILDRQAGWIHIAQDHHEALSADKPTDTITEVNWRFLLILITHVEYVHRTVFGQQLTFLEEVHSWRHPIWQHISYSWYRMQCKQYCRFTTRQFWGWTDWPLAVGSSSVLRWRGFDMKIWAMWLAFAAICFPFTVWTFNTSSSVCMSISWSNLQKMDRI